MKLTAAIGSPVAIALAFATALVGPVRPAAAQGAAGSVDRSSKEVLALEPPEVFDRITTNDGLPQSSVQAIGQDGTGFIWLGTQAGLARYDGQNIKVFLPAAGDPTTVSGATITALATDAHGGLWVGTAENGVSLYDPQTGAFRRFPSFGKPGTGVAAILVDHAGRAWFGSSAGGLVLYQPQTGTFKRFVDAPLDLPITAIAADKAGNLWVGNAHGVIRFDPKNRSTRVYHGTKNAQLVDAQISAIAVDAHGIVWVGTQARGALALAPASGAVTRYRAGRKAGLSSNQVMSILADRGGNVWIGTSNGLDRFDRKHDRFDVFHHDARDSRSIAGSTVLSLFQDRGGVIWAGSLTNGASKFDVSRLNFGFYNTHAAAIGISDGTSGPLWVGTFHGGLYELERDAGRVVHYLTIGDPNAGGLDLRSTRVVAVHKDRSGQLWLGTDRGLVRFNPQTGAYKIYPFNPDDPHSLHGQLVAGIWGAPQGILWLATFGGGLERFDPRTESFTAFTAEDQHGITSDYLHGLYPDPTNPHILWLRTAKGGVDRFDLRTGTATSYLHDPKNPNSLSNDDVLCLYRDSASNLWVGTYGGGLDRIELNGTKIQRFTTANSGLSNDDVYGVLPDKAGNLWISTNGGGLLRFTPKTHTFTHYTTSDGIQANEFAGLAYRRNPKTGELFFGGIHGLDAFFPSRIKPNPYTPPVVITRLKVSNRKLKLSKPIWTGPKLDLDHSDSFEIAFAAMAFANPKHIKFSYKLGGRDDKWIQTHRRFVTYSKLGGGDYTFRVRASNGNGGWSKAAAIHFHVTPPLWLRWWAYAIYALAFAGLIIAAIRRNRQKLTRLERDARLASVEKDLELTGAVQTAFLPRANMIDEPRFRLFGFYRPANACSGDWWWYDRPSEGVHSILVGDVTGHGPGPAMVTAAAATAVHVQSSSGSQPIDTILKTLNREVLHVGGGKYQMTMAALRIEEKTGRYVFYSAGAPPILVLKADGSRARAVPCRGTPLGTADFTTGVAEGQLTAGERVLMYTDGIPELVMENGNLLGMRRFCQIYERTRELDLEAAAESIVQQSDAYRAGPIQDDDWTFAIMEWR